jgi:hypothetical protein
MITETKKLTESDINRIKVELGHKAGELIRAYFEVYPKDSEAAFQREGGIASACYWNVKVQGLFLTTPDDYRVKVSFEKADWADEEIAWNARERRKIERQQGLIDDGVKCPVCESKCLDLYSAKENGLVEYECCECMEHFEGKF